MTIPGQKQSFRFIRLRVPMLFRQLRLFCTTIILTFISVDSRACSNDSGGFPFEGPSVVVITPATRSVQEAVCYIDTMKSIERTGARQWPMNDGVKLYGVLRAKISIRSDGALDNVSVIQSSGQPLLDAAAQGIVTASAPFSRCAIKKKAVVAPAWEIEYRFSFGAETLITD